MCFVYTKCWCWSLRSVFMHLYIESTIQVHERTRCFHFLLRGRFTGTSYWRWKGSQLHPLTFKTTMLLFLWCQKLEYYHFKSNLEFKAKEIKIGVILFLVLKPMNCRKAWNGLPTSCFTFFIPLYATCYTNGFPSMFVIFCGLLFHSCIWDISRVSREQSKAARGQNTWLWVS